MGCWQRKFSRAPVGVVARWPDTEQRRPFVVAGAARAADKEQRRLFVVAGAARAADKEQTDTPKHQINNQYTNKSHTQQ